GRSWPRQQMDVWFCIAQERSPRGTTAGRKTFRRLFHQPQMILSRFDWWVLRAQNKALAPSRMTRFLGNLAPDPDSVNFNECAKNSGHHQSQLSKHILGGRLYNRILWLRFPAEASISPRS